jgi:glycosyltransferase involved in cell wall biosynthesis
MVAYTLYDFDARVRREAETLAAHGFSVRCLTLKRGPVAATYVLNGVEVLETDVPKYRGKSTLAYIASYLRFLGATSLACLRLLRRRQLDVVHVHNLPDFLVLAGVVPRLFRRKVVLDIHDSVPETFATKFSGSALAWKALCLEERLSARIAHRVICVNEPQRKVLNARGIPVSKTFVSMNVPDPAIFGRHSDAARLPEADGPFNLVYHGTMSARLGVDLIIRAVAALLGRVPSARLQLWGAGDDLCEFQGLARDLGVQDHVVFEPQGFGLEELPARLRAMHVGVIGNRRTAAGHLMLPVKLLEYVSLGIPAVVPRLRTIEHYFSDDMVLFYEPENVESLADGVHRLYSRPELAARQAERARAFLTRHGWERQGPEITEFYEELVEN